ncbi:MAG: hypothetical protein HOP08_05835 [Cyclobacteriaceae bacterium]|nr:hypothetical protein [Cyclobacteriaceae bacterium]
MKNPELKNLASLDITYKELTLTEQQSIVGGSGITYGIGYGIGYALGSLGRGIKWVWNEIARDPVYYMGATMTA